jgi:hypothetical protein
MSCNNMSDYCSKYWHPKKRFAVYKMVIVKLRQNINFEKLFKTSFTFYYIPYILLLCTLIKTYLKK